MSDVILWVSLRELGGWPGVTPLRTPITDAQLAQWKALGFDGLISSFGWLRGMGGNQEFYLGSGSIPSDPFYAMHKAIVNNNLVERCHDAGLKLYLGFNTANTNNLATPLAKWWDGPGWDIINKYIKNVAAGAKLLGFDGLSPDLEPYSGTGSWKWNYTGNVQSQASTRVAVYYSGLEFGQIIADEFPDVPLSLWAVRPPGGWANMVRGNNPYSKEVQVNFIDGLANVSGIQSIDLVDEWFYWGTQTAEPWNVALDYDQTQIAHLSDVYGWNKVKLFPGAWLNSDGAGRPAQTVNYTATQLNAYKASQPSGPVYIFHYGKMVPADYEPYGDILRSISSDPAVALPLGVATESDIAHKASVFKTVPLGQPETFG